MLPTCRPILIAVLAVLLSGPPALAQQTHPRAAPIPAAADSSRSAENLDLLLGQLRQADGEAAAKAIEQSVWKAWMRSGSPTVDLLVQQAEKAMADEQYGIAISMLTTAIELEPEFPEVWNRRATAYFLDRQFEEALADAERVLELEPRHFAALAGIGVIHQEMGDLRAALQAFRRALAIHPFLSAARRAVRTLELEFEQDI